MTTPSTKPSKSSVTGSTAIGVAEPDITRQAQTIVVQLPGVEDAQRALELVGQTAELRFRPVFNAFSPLDVQERVNAAQQLVVLNSLIDEANAPGSTTAPESTTTTTSEVLSAPTLDELLTDPDMEDPDAAVALRSLDDSFVYVLGPTEATGEIISTASATFTNEWQVSISFTSDGSDIWDDMTSRNFGRQLAIALDGVVYSAPTINAREFGGRAVINGRFSESEAKDLALVLRFGALPLELEPQTVQAVSATLGQDALRAGIVAGIVGLALVALYMILFYRLLGVVAILSLGVSGAMLWFIISWLGEWKGLALTLAGATGIVLSIGVAVDSNIVYYERIKEEVLRGRSVRSAAEGAFAGAFSTIVKADSASIIGALILYTLTVGAVRGFALSWE